LNTNSKEVETVANQIYQQLTDAQIEVLFDDRANMSPGFKFKDADLLGMPFQVIVGDKGLKNGQVEIKRRRTGERLLVKFDETVSEVQKLLAE
jgi:prolyl-tRNA synthetase